MALEQALKDLMTIDGTYANVTSLDVYGQKTVGTPVSFKCRVTINRNENYTPEESGTISYTATIIMDGVYGVLKNARITINGEEFWATRVTTYSDERGNHHTSIEAIG